MTSGSARRGQRPADTTSFEKKLTRICVGLVIAGPVLGMGAGMLGAGEIYPSDYMIPVALGVMLGLIGLGLLIAACAGLYLLGGWKATPFGFAFVGGFAALVYGLVEIDRAWRDTGVILLAISCAAFWVAPALSKRPKKSGKRAPAVPGKTAGVGGVFAVGAAIAIAGHLTDVWWLMLFGAMAAGTAAGGGIAMWLERRAQDEAA
ncbi:hypothetical protein BAY61_01220 [Prauserella marina]|uniref:Uncharacterized protein n=1 Tax=Prauserella marina TaxID=530584 RepID=A0A222VIX3_9PSEU|nr:hypothetical protein [Prauserella marina]ASR33834.1 hypothetical protein BAY61_01220 [Prauserella marina]PWV82419.1 hypothetical protein DES30_102660 [Prauserella marina]SDC68691.1 hypothetical protein SAMN05421630_103196 [Prauserella marina]